MNIMIAAFGLAQEIYWKFKSSAGQERQSFFYDVPPFLPTAHSLTIDITPFILYDKIVINKTWVEQKGGLKDAVFSGSILDKESVNELIRKGIVEIRDYETDTNNHLSLLEKVTNYDLDHSDLWQDILHESSSRWMEYEDRMRGEFRKIEQSQLLARPSAIRNALAHSGFVHMALHGIRTRADPYDFSRLVHDPHALQETIRGYLLGVNNTLLLSREYSVSLFDWFDYEPFYSAKAMWRAMGATSPMSTAAKAGTILSFYLPLEQISSVTELIQIRDKAKGLREYIDAKYHDDSGADEITLAQILNDIERAQKNIERLQKITSYFTIPLSLIPVPLVGSLLEKVAGDVISLGIEKKLLEEYKWHFSLLNFASSRYAQKALFQPTQQNLLLENTEEFHQCESFTKRGRRCKNLAKPGYKYCQVHSKQEI